jgi:hypothetical protein
MRKSILFIAFFAIIASPVFSQFTFSASPGLNLNSATFGYKVGKFVPYAGLQFLNAKFNYTRNDFKYVTAGTLIEYDNKVDVKAGIYLPTLGAKYFFVENNKLKAYLNLSLTKPIIKGSVEFTSDGEKTNEEFSDGVKETIDNIKLFGGEFGFGVEYYFDDNFSVGGEFGLRCLNAKYSTESAGTANNGNTDVNVTYTTDLKLNLIPTYTKVSLNFYFGGGEK